MNSRERVSAVLNFDKFDRLPVVEWAGYWDLTLDRWRSEGLPKNLVNHEDIREYFGLDRFLQLSVVSAKPTTPAPDGHGKPIIRNEKDYLEILPYLYPEPAANPAELERLAAQEQKGAAIWCWMDAFFWHPRWLFGIEEHFYSFFDQPQLMKTMNEHLLEFFIRAIDQMCEYISPQFLSLGEDMSYNHGPMISKAIFDEQLAPFYIEVNKHIKSKGIKAFVDSDGLVDEPVDWYAEVGSEGFLPLEKQAGVDLIRYRKKHPKFLFLGGFDKTGMNKGEEVLRNEFERLLPVMRQGGYIPGVDHQTPPEVSLQDYRLYLKLLREYCELAAK